MILQTTSEKKSLNIGKLRFRANIQIELFFGDHLSMNLMKNQLKTNVSKSKPSEVLTKAYYSTKPTIEH